MIGNNRKAAILFSLQIVTVLHKAKLILCIYKNLEEIAVLIASEVKQLKRQCFGIKPSYLQTL